MKNENPTNPTCKKDTNYMGTFICQSLAKSMETAELPSSSPPNINDEWSLI